MKKLLTVIAAFMAVISVSAADSTAVAHRIEVSLRGAYVLPSNRIVKGGNRFGAHTDAAFGGAVEYSFSFSPRSRYGRYYPYAYQGIGIGATGFSSSKVTGNPVNIYVLQGSRIASFSRRLTLDYEWNFGISAGWKKIATPSRSTIPRLPASVRMSTHISIWVSSSNMLSTSISVL